MTDTNQKLREALQVARDHIDMDALEISHCKDATLIRQALALPTADHLPDAGEMVGAELPKLDELIEEFELAAIDKHETRNPGYEFEHRAHDTACERYEAARAALSAQAVPNPWRDAVIEQLESWHIYVPAIHENSPRLAIKALVNIETQAALDPKVSSQAAALAAGAVPDERDKVDAQRYRWLADCLNYPEAVTLISDGSLTADALGKAIDTAMRKDKP